MLNFTPFSLEQNVPLQHTGHIGWLSHTCVCFEEEDSLYVWVEFSSVRACVSPNICACRHTDTQIPNSWGLWISACQLNSHFFFSPVQTHIAPHSHWANPNSKSVCLPRNCCHHFFLYLPLAWFLSFPENRGLSVLGKEGENHHLITVSDVSWNGKVLGCASYWVMQLTVCSLN